MMKWRWFGIISLLLWTNFVFAGCMSISQSLSQTHTNDTLTLFSQKYAPSTQLIHHKLKGKNKLTFQQVHYLWLKNKKNALIQLNSLSSSSHLLDDNSLTPTYPLLKATHVLAIPGNQRLVTSLAFQPYWMKDSSAKRNRLNGWKDSNIQYKGSLTYHHV